MIENGLIFGHDGETLHWHLPVDRSSGYLPDRELEGADAWRQRHELVLWYYLKDHKDEIAGFAHSHPWNGRASPSGIDLGTFRRIDKHLGVRFVWPIVTFTDVLYLRWHEEGQCYAPTDPVALAGLGELRARSRT